MAISINISNTHQNDNSTTIIAPVLSNQSPFDFALSYLETIEDLYGFFQKQTILDYEDFYNKKKYKIENYNNALKNNGYVSATRTIYINNDFNKDFNKDFLA